MEDISKILKDCPRGTRVYSLMYGYLSLDEVTDSGDIVLYDDTLTNLPYLDKYGRLSESGACLLYPSEESRDWSEWKIQEDSWSISDAKDGDILVSRFGHPFVFKSYDGIKVASHCGLIRYSSQLILDSEPCDYWTESTGVKPANDMDKSVFFDKLRADGCVWNADTKTLIYTSENLGNISDEPSYDKVEFQPFDKVLVRTWESDEWDIDLFVRKKIREDGCMYNCMCNNWRYCIPYNDTTKSLLGTTNDCPECYK